MQFETDRVAALPHYPFPAPQIWFDILHSETKGYVAYLNICPTNKPVGLSHHLFCHVPNPSASRTLFPCLASFPHTAVYHFHRMAPVHSSQRNRCTQPGSLPPMFGKTGHYRHRLLSSLFAEILAMSQQFHWPLPNSGCIFAEWDSPSDCIPHSQS